MIASGRDVVHPLGIAQTLAVALPGVGMLHVTPKSDDRARYAAETRVAIGRSLRDLAGSGRLE